MKTLYEVLEVSETASKEIIDKTYRVLAKKYHPDLQQDGDKKAAEEKMKEINEAYDTLSDDTKRQNYDAKLKAEREEEKAREEAARQQQMNQNSQQAYYNQEQYTQTPNYNPNSSNVEQQYTGQRQVSEEEYREALRRQQEAFKRQQQMEQQMQAQYERKYQRAYEDYLRSLGYKIKYKWTWKNYRDFLITILVIIGICLTLWIFPPTHKMIVDIYNSNVIIKTVVDIIGGIFKGIWNAICSIFTKKSNW